VDDVLRTTGPLAGRAVAARLPTGERRHAGPERFALDAEFADIARHDSRPAASPVATGIQYPAYLASHPNRRRPADLLIWPPVLSLLGLPAAAAIRRPHRGPGVAS
jgi:hypothetical protein